MFKNSQTRAKQYACVVPDLGFQASHVTLASSSCPLAEEEYLPVLQPRVVPDGLALCAKVAMIAVTVTVFSIATSSSLSSSSSASLS